MEFPKGSSGFPRRLCDGLQVKLSNIMDNIDLSSMQHWWPIVPRSSAGAVPGRHA